MSNRRVVHGADWCVRCDKRKCSEVWGGLPGYEWCIFSESDKSSYEYLSTFEGAMEKKTEEMNCET
jgi:hypothetical protein